MIKLYIINYELICKKYTTKEVKLMKIAIYSRKSKYSATGDSIENQIQMCKDFAKSKYRNEDLEFNEYEDEGY